MGRASREFARHYLIGLFMGTADAVPGVSGGTIAFIAGIYSRLIDAIAGISLAKAHRLLGTLFPPDYRRFRAILVELDAGFLFSLVMGVVTALVVVTRFIVFAEARYPVVLFGFFFGLIAAAVPILWRQVSLTEPRHYAVALAGFSLSFVISGDVTLLQGHGFALIFLAGFIAICAMILPGISGALLLVILGQYVYLSTTLTAFTDGVVALTADGSIAALVRPGTTIAVFVSGAILGLLTIARLVDRALERWPTMTVAFLVSLVVGALRAPLVEISNRGIPWTTETIGWFLAAGAVGAVVLFLLDYVGMDVDIDGGFHSRG